MKKGFTLVELLAVIVILAIILIIAIPQIMYTIKATRTKSLESSVKLIAASAEKDYLAQQTLNASYNKTGIPCSDVAKLNDDYASCNIEYNSEGTATVTILGKADGKYGNIACSGTKDGITCSEDISSVCDPIEICIEEGQYFTTTKVMQLLSDNTTEEFNSYLNKYMEFVSNSNFLINDEDYYLALFIIMEGLFQRVPVNPDHDLIASYFDNGDKPYVIVYKNRVIGDDVIGFISENTIGKDNIFINTELNGTRFSSVQHDLSAGTSYYFINSKLDKVHMLTQTTENVIYLYNSRVTNIDANNYDSYCDSQVSGILPNRVYIDNLSTINGGAIDRLYDMNNNEITSGNSNVTNVIEGQAIVDRYDLFLQENPDVSGTLCILY